MSKHDFWMGQFDGALPVFVAERWVSRHLDLIEKKCEELGIEHLCAFVGHSYAKPNVGEWAIRHGGFVQLALEELESGTPFDKELYIKLTTVNFTQTPKWGDGLAARMKVTLGEAITKMDWWTENLPAIRKACANTSKVKKVMES